MEFNDIRMKAAGMVKADTARDKMFKEYDDMVHLTYELPGTVGKLPGMHKVISTDPYDAVRAGTRVFSKATPRPKFQPLYNSTGTKKNASEIEQALTWWFTLASRRGKSNPLQDIVESSLRYSEVSVQVVSLDYQEKELGAKLKRERRYGPFAVLVHNPKSVHAKYTDWGVEAVVLVKEQFAYEVEGFWKDKAKGLRDARMGDEDKLYDRVVVYDYWDETHRCVWVEPGGANFSPLDMQTDNTGGAKTGGRRGMQAMPGHKAIVIIEPKEHKIGFLPWVCKIGGSNLDSDTEHARIPLLYSIAQSGQWNTSNILESLVMYKAVTAAGKPVKEVRGPNAAEAVDEDMDVFGGQRNVAPGHEVRELQPDPLDVGLLNLSERVTQRINKSTVSRILQGGDVGAGTAFSTLNLATQTAVGSLNPWKVLAENALAEIYTMMLDWIRENGTKVRAFGAGRMDLGAQYEIDPATIPEDDIYITVELTPDIPSDRQQRINAAGQAVQLLNYPVERGLEDIGVTDPIEAMGQRKREQLEDMVFQAEMQKYAAAVQLEIEMRTQAAQMQMQQELQAQQPPPGPDPTQQGFNPALGGQPPVQANPQAATFEGATGAARNGVPIQGAF